MSINTSDSPRDRFERAKHHTRLAVQIIAELEDEMGKNFDALPKNARNSEVGDRHEQCALNLDLVREELEEIDFDKVRFPDEPEPE
jgi:hypothetical protein